jgi:hypothetical protein
MQELQLAQLAQQTLVHLIVPLEWALLLLD